MESLSLEEYSSVPHVSPEVSDRVAAMSPTRLALQYSATGWVWTRLAYLLLPCLVTDGRPDGDLGPAGQETPPRADQDSQARLLEDVDVMVVGISHGPPARVALGFLAVGREDVATVTVSPLRPGVHTVHQLGQK